MERITDFEELQNGKQFVVFTCNGEYNLYKFFGKEPNGVEGYAYFLNVQTKDVVRLHKSVVEWNECFEMETYDTIAIGQKLIEYYERKIKSIQERINNEKLR